MKEKYCKTRTVLTVLILLAVGIIMTGVASAMVIADLDGVNDGQTKVVTINYDRFMISPLRYIYISGKYDFVVDKRLSNIIKNLGPENIRTYVGSYAVAGYPNDIKILIQGQMLYSIYVDNIAKAFSVGINNDEEALINSEILKDPTLAQKIKIEVVTTEAVPEL